MCNKSLKNHFRIGEDILTDCITNSLHYITDLRSRLTEVMSKVSLGTTNELYTTAGPHINNINEPQS